MSDKACEFLAKLNALMDERGADEPAKFLTLVIFAIDGERIDYVWRDGRYFLKD